MLVNNLLSNECIDILYETGANTQDSSEWSLHLKPCSTHSLKLVHLKRDPNSTHLKTVNSKQFKLHSIKIHL